MLKEMAAQRTSRGAAAPRRQGSSAPRPNGAGGSRPTDPAATSQQDSDLTIDELARRTGMTVRNIRAHQSRGLIPPPQVRARTGYYGPDHVARIELIQELQADGYSLDLIRRILRSAGARFTGSAMMAVVRAEACRANATSVCSSTGKRW